jgi:hypothetical protein
VESKPGSVRDDHLSRFLRTGGVSRQTAALVFRPWRATCNGRFGDCRGEDCPFQPFRTPKGSERNGFCCSRTAETVRQSGLSTACAASLAFTRRPRSARPGLSSNPCGPAIILPPIPSVINVHDPETGSRRQTVRFAVECRLVPRGRFELPRVAPLRPERSASASSATSAFGRRQLRSSGADPGTRTRDLLFTKQLLYQLS